MSYVPRALLAGAAIALALAASTSAQSPPASATAPTSTGPAATSRSRQLTGVERLEKQQRDFDDATRSQILAALANFQRDMGRLPTTAEGLNYLVANVGNSDQWHGPYLKAFPTESHGFFWLYIQPGQHQVFDLIAPRLFSGGIDLEISTQGDTSTQLIILRQALEIFRTDNRRYPTSAEGLPALLTPPAALQRTWRGPYVRPRYDMNGVNGTPYNQDHGGHFLTYRSPSPAGPNTYELSSPALEQEQRRPNAEPVDPPRPPAIGRNSRPMP
jgi:hypothetical protein